MKKLLLMLLVGVAVSVTAQTKEKFYSERVQDNWFISVGGGAQANMNPDNFDKGIGNAITPVISGSIGKLFNPVWGVRGQAAGVWTTLYSKYGVSQANGQAFREIKNKHYIAFRADALYNITNAIAGYNPDRLFTLSAFGGPGLTLAKAYGRQQDLNLLIAGSVGLMGQFNVSQYIDINVEARGEISPSIFGRYSSAHTDGAVSLIAGVSYTFGGKKFAPVGCDFDPDALNAEINRYRRALADAEAELAAAKNALANVRPEIREVVKEVEVAGPRAIFFQIGQSKIDDYGLVNIQLAAKTIKANTNKRYKIAGYADKATGSSTFNQQLSERRAQAVYDALIKEGVSGSQLELVSHGGADNMFGKNMLNRVVILE